ncbi:MFS general substrate transporter [Rhizodiscina lignyota]|uniref:MFS general substrate transporter n=1 Tax=Rhizodiscina lignyota TaxID=1504668 RepID=A0A9P4ILE9_9PEZI|nr:MFS general substrate transporter [Rhizodiscina lignyota]
MPDDSSAAGEQTPLLASSRSSAKPDSNGTVAPAPPDTAAGKGTSAVDNGIGVIRGIAITIATGVLIFFQATNMSMITTIQSSIAADLDAYEEVTWFTSAYLVSMSSFAPIMGRLSATFSPRRCIFYATIFFAVGSLIAAFARSFKEFIVGRAVQGIGGAGVFSVAIIIVLQLASTEKRGLLIGMLNSGYTVGVALGAIVAGALLPLTGWRFVFWIQAPFTFVAGFVLLFAIPKAFSKNKSSGKESIPLARKLLRLDYVGALALIGGITFLLIGLSASKILVIPIIISLILLPLFVLNEIYIAKDPIIPVIVLKSRGVLLSCLATAGFMMCRWCVLFYTPVYSIAVRGWSPATAGTILIPTNGGFALGGLVVGWIHIRRAGSFYAACVVTFVLFPITLLILSLASTPSIHPAVYVLATFANGLTVGAALNYTLAHVLHLTLPESHFIVSALLATFRGFAGSFGSAIGGGVFSRILRATLEDGFAKEGLTGEGPLIRKLLGSPALVKQLTGVEKAVAVTGYVSAIRGLFASAAGLAAVFILAQAGTGWRGPNDKSKDEEEDANEGVAVTFAGGGQQHF